MGEEKKDLTNILDLSKKMEAEGTLPSPAEGGAVMEENKIEKIEAWESLEEYSKTNPVAEPPPDDMPPDAPGPVTSPGMPNDSQFVTTPDLEQPADASFMPSAGGAPAADFPAAAETGRTDVAAGAETTGAVEDSQAGLAVAPPPPDTSEYSGAVTGAGVDNPVGADGLADSLPPAGANIAPPQNLGGVDSTSTGAKAPAPETEVSAPIAALEPEPSRPEPSLPPPPPPTASRPPLSGSEAFKRMRTFADRTPIGKPAVPASYPFSLMITGRLTPEEREKLVDALNRHSFGIREVDLEPQWEGEKILIPRISEYAAILLVQAMRGTSAQMRLGPADSIYSTEDTKSANDQELDAYDAIEEQVRVFADATHPAESIPVTSQPTLPNLPAFIVVDAVTASAALKTTSVEATSSSEYQEVIESLQRELKYKAFRRGATAIVNFTVTLSSMSMPTHYRVTVIGSAIRPPSKDSTQKPGAPPPLPAP